MVVQLYGDVQENCVILGGEDCCYSGDLSKDSWNAWGLSMAHLGWGLPSSADAHECVQEFDIKTCLTACISKCCWLVKSPFQLVMFCEFYPLSWYCSPVLWSRKPFLELEAGEKKVDVTLGEYSVAVEWVFGCDKALYACLHFKTSYFITSAVKFMILGMEDRRTGWGGKPPNKHPRTQGTESQGLREGKGKRMQHEFTIS